MSGTTALVGAWDGAVSVFEREGSTWSQRQTLTFSEQPAGTFFLQGLALSGDHALVGGYVYQDTQPATYLPGTAHLFRRNNSEFSEIQRFSIPRQEDYFGRAVALSADTALVGAPGTNNPNASASGAVFVFTAPPSVAPVAVSPAGPSANNWPTYRFTRVEGATLYRLSVANAFEQVFTLAEAHCATEVEFCTVKATSPLPQGESTWQVRAESAGGASPWSNTLTTSVAETARPPASAPLVIEPKGTTYSTTPTYRWNAVPMATRYWLWVNDPTASGTPLRTVLETRYSEELGCEWGGVCTLTPAKALALGAAKWWVLAENPLGATSWSPATDILVTTLPPPAAPPVLFAPIGTVVSGSINYSFSSVSHATEYYLWVNDSSGHPRLQKTYSAEIAGCSGGTCTVTPNEPVGTGLRTWWVRAQNSSGHSAWSAPASFTIGDGSPPGVPTLLGPSGSTTSPTPTYTWSAVTDATKYLLWVNDAQGQRLVRYYTAEAAECADGTCAVTPEIAVARGAAIWWLQAVNDAGPGAWVSQSFTVEPL